MSIDERLPDLIAVLSNVRCRFTNERELQDGIERALTAGKLAFTREASLSAKDRVDFLVGDIAVEIKVDGTLANVTRQLHRYAEHETVAAVVLVTSRMQHKAMPEEMVGKPVRVVHLVWSAF